MSFDKHLSDDQIDEHLMGALDEKSTLHLLGCESCQARAAALEAPIASFRKVSLAWSERQAATMQARPADFQLRPSLRARAAWTLTATAAICVSIALPMAHHGRSASGNEQAHQPSASVQTFAAERDEQIAQDNEMLQAINREIGSTVHSPSETFGLVAEDDTRAASRATRD